MEYLETEGVAVVGYGTDEFPAFFSPSSGLSVSVRMDSAEEVAALIAMQFRLGLKSGILVGVPIPNEYAHLGDRISQAVDSAVQAAE